MQHTLEEGGGRVDPYNYNTTTAIKTKNLVIRSYKMFLMVKVRMVVTSIICGNLVIMIVHGYILFIEKTCPFYCPFIFLLLVDGVVYILMDEFQGISPV